VTDRFKMEPGDLADVTVYCRHCGVPAHPSCRCGARGERRVGLRRGFDFEWMFRERPRYQREVAYVVKDEHGRVVEIVTVSGESILIRHADA
jgi:hypothetical protein